MSIVNLQRDAFFSNQEKTSLSFSVAQPFDETDFNMNADATVYDSYATARSNRLNALTLASADDCEAIGLYMRPPGSELTPYRVKCYAGADDVLVKFRLIIGFAEGTISGANDVITHFLTFPFDTNLDELFMLEPAGTTGDSPIAFGIMLRGVYTDAHADVSLSVQRLATSPPQFSQSVS